VGRFWFIGGVLVLLGALVVGLLIAGNDARLELAPILADATSAGCDGPGQLNLRVGNASGQVIARVEGVISVATTAGETARPVGNFEVQGPLEAGQALAACVAVDDGLLEGRDRTRVIWLARSTSIDFAE
jgi:hypothetical protein